jgi:hypothetical protein
VAGTAASSGEAVQAARRTNNVPAKIKTVFFFAFIVNESIFF